MHLQITSARNLIAKIGTIANIGSIGSIATTATIATIGSDLHNLHNWHNQAIHSICNVESVVSSAVSFTLRLSISLRSDWKFIKLYDSIKSKFIASNALWEECERQ